MNPELMRAAERRDNRRMAICAHEVGHGLAGLAFGLETNGERLKFGLLGGFIGGACDWDYFNDDTPRDHKIAWLVGIMGGHAAEIRFCQLYLRMDARKAFKYGRDWAEGDYQNFDHYRAKWRRDGVRVSRDWAFDQASRAIERNADRLDRLTLRLDKAARLPGSAL